MADLETVHEEIREIRQDADREVREALTSIERALSEMQAANSGPKADRLEEVRAELDRLASETDGETAARIDRVREAIRDYEAESA